MTNNGDQTNAGGGQSYRVSITPTWEVIAKISIEALVNGTEEGQRLAREELIDLGIKLDDAKEIIEGTDTETYKKQLNRINNQVRHIEQLESKVEARDKELNASDDHVEELEQKIEEKDKTIAELKERVDKLGKTIDNIMGERDEWKADAQRIAGLKTCIGDLESTLAFKNQQIINLEEAKRELQKYWDERNVQQPGLPGIKHEDPVHEQIVDVIHASKVAKINKLDPEACDLVGIRELMVYTINQQIKYNETHGEDPEYDAELANGDGQDTSIDEQVANNQPHREGDE